MREHTDTQTYIYTHTHTLYILTEVCANWGCFLIKAPRTRVQFPVSYTIKFKFLLCVNVKQNKKKMFRISNIGILNDNFQ